MCLDSYKEAYALKDQARRSPNQNPLFHQAYQENMRAATCAEILAVKDPAPDRRQKYDALKLYYRFEAYSCLLPFLDPIEEKISMLEKMSGILQRGREFLARCNDAEFVNNNKAAWEFLQLNNDAECVASQADAYRDKYELLRAADYYEQAADKYQAAYEYYLSDKTSMSTIDATMNRLVLANINACRCNISAMKFYFNKDKNHIPEATACILKILEDAQKLCDTNPEWEPNFEKKAQYETLAMNFLADHKSLWKHLKAKFRNKMLERLMKDVDLDHYESISGKKRTEGVYVMSDMNVKMGAGSVLITNTGDNFHIGDIHTNSPIASNVYMEDVEEFKKIVKESVSKELGEKLIPMLDEWKEFRKEGKEEESKDLAEKIRKLIKSNNIASQLFDKAGSLASIVGLFLK